MGEFSWAYISGGVTTEGPDGSVQFKSGDSALSGTGNFTYDSATDLLALTGSMEISGTLTANQYNINVIDKTVTNLSASGDTKFGDTSDDTHQFTGSVFVTNNLSASFLYGNGTNIDGITATDISGSKGQFSTTSGVMTLTGSATVDGTVEVSGNVNIRQNANFFQGFATNGQNVSLIGVTAGNVTRVGNQGYDIHLADDVTVSGSLIVSGALGDALIVDDDGSGGVKATLTGSLVVTGSGQSLITLETRDADSLKEIVFNKDGAAAAAIQINSNEHMFIENENPKDIILRTNNQNTIRVFGANQRVGIAKTGTTGNATLDINGSLAVSGSSTIGLDSSDQSTFGGGLTASLGVSLGENSFVASNKNIVFGSGGNSVIQYNSGLNKLIISGSLGAGGIDLQGGEITVDFPGGTVASGSLGGPGSYLGLDSNNRMVLTSSAAGGAPGGANTQIQINDNGSFGGSANLTFDNTAGAEELALTGSMEVVSGSTPVFEINSGNENDEKGAVRGRMVQTIVSQFDLTNGSFAAAGRYIDLHGAAGVSNTLDRQNALLTPFSGRLISITYHFPGGTQNSANGTPQWELRVADVNQLKGSTINAAVVATAQCTASSWPGTNYVGGVNVQNGQGTLGGTNTTGSWAFGTGSAVGLRFKSGDGTSLNIPGQAIVTTVWEFDQLDPFISGSGN